MAVDELSKFKELRNEAIRKVGWVRPHEASPAPASDTPGLVISPTPTDLEGDDKGLWDQMQERQQVLQDEPISSSRPSKDCLIPTKLRRQALMSCSPKHLGLNPIPLKPKLIDPDKGDGDASGANGETHDSSASDDNASAKGKNK